MAPSFQNYLTADQVAREIGVKAALLATAGQACGRSTDLSADAHDNDAGLQTSGSKKLLRALRAGYF
ncbi:MAG: hypothetical protein IPP97_14055 [Candidatus Obscuribacter sp.]|nr:hypothetical protein [Candidatus Obscuribacter sp.]